MKYKMFRRLIGKCENCAHWTPYKIGDHITSEGVCFQFSNQGHFRILSIKTPINGFSDKIELSTYKSFGCTKWFPRIGRHKFYHGKDYGTVA